MNELFIENRKTHRSQPTTVRSADCDIRHYPNGVSSDATCNAIAIEVMTRSGETREKELINIKFTDNSIWSGTFKDLQKALQPSPLTTAAPAMLEALDFIVNDIPEPGENAQLTVEGYNKACAAIQKAKPA